MGGERNPSLLEEAECSEPDSSDCHFSSPLNGP